MMWIRFFEAWLTARLLASPTFHRGVQLLHKKLREVRHGKDPSEMGGINIDKPEATGVKKFLDYYIEELREQFRGGNKKR
ncbi:MAG: hypothetical protein M1823_002966 [Watsoniomyces obsoletus]|nr:MAG: hypothetical protein M1823_002966 [Watsoniomyces obsoletus]